MSDQGKFAPPRAVGTPPREISLRDSLDGKLIAWQDDQPIFITMVGTDALYLGLFADASTLRAVMEHLHITG